MKATLLVKAEKWAIWLGLIATLVLLHRLLPVIFLTFILAYIGSSLVRILGKVIPWRRVNALLVLLLFLSILASVGVLIVPRIFAGARELAVGYITRDSDQTTATSSPADHRPAADSQQTLLERQTKKYFDSVLVRVVGRKSFDSYSRSEEYQMLLTKVEAALRSFIPRVIGAVVGFANASLGVVLQFFLSIVLSFVIIFDFPELCRQVRMLATGRTADIFAEVAPGIQAFGAILGRAFQAQTVVAIANACLTSIGFLVLGLPSIALLATIVFVCSYIPVAGVLLSTVPAALLAFKTGGFTLALWLLVMVLIVHAIEAYALNPLIYGSHMKMHPVVILAILLVGEHLFGVWGLLLAVPIGAFVREYVLGIASGAPADVSTASAGTAAGT